MREAVSLFAIRDSLFAILFLVWSEKPITVTITRAITKFDFCPLIYRARATR